METLEELISKIKSDSEEYLRRAYNLGAAKSEDDEDDHPILPPLEPSFIPPPFPDDPLKIIKWPGDTPCCELHTWELFKQFENNSIYAGVHYVLCEVIAPIIYKRHRLKTILYDLSAGRNLKPGEYNGHPGQSHSFGAFDKQYYGWPNRLLPIPEYEFTEMCSLCFGNRYEHIAGHMVESAMELVAHKKLSYVVSDERHKFDKSEGSHGHHRCDLGGLWIEKDEMRLLMYEL